MLILHNAIVPFDGDEIVITDPKSIKTFSVDHSMPSGDATRIELDSGTVYLVKESIDEIVSVMEA